MTSPPPSRFRTWLQLFRAPNLFTVPGDPLAGYLFANNGFVDLSLALVIGASLAFYMAGLLMNDLADEAEDRRERPNRPLPSGAASRPAVITVMLGLFTLGLVLLLRIHSGGAVYCGIAVIFAITLYNCFTKHWPFVGAVNMGLCRGLSVLLGGFAGPLAIHGMAIFPMLAIGIYIAVVTNLARHETRAQSPALARLLPGCFLVIACLGGIGFDRASPATMPGIFIFALTAIAGLLLARRLFSTPPIPLPPLIGAHIRILLPLQAALCFSGDPWGAGLVSAILLICLWPLSRLVSKRFYAS